MLLKHSPTRRSPPSNVRFSTLNHCPDPPRPSPTVKPRPMPSSCEAPRQRLTASTKPIEKLLFEAATRSGCTDDDALEQALQTAGKNGGRFIDAILDADIVPDEAAFFQTLSRALGLHFTRTADVDPRNPPHARLPARVALRHRVLPGRSEGNTLQLLTYDPFDLDARQTAGQTLDLDVTWVLSTRTAILEALRTG